MYSKKQLKASRYYNGVVRPDRKSAEKQDESREFDRYLKSLGGAAPKRPRRRV